MTEVVTGNGATGAVQAEPILEAHGLVKQFPVRAGSCGERAATCMRCAT